jgi:hypothetical protein
MFYFRSIISITGMVLEIELRPGRRLLVGAGSAGPASPHSLLVTDAGVDVRTRVRAEAATLAAGTAGAWDLAARLEGMRACAGVGARNVREAHVRDASVSMSRFAVLSGARGGTGAPSPAPGGVAIWGASGVRTDASLAFDAAGLRCPALTTWRVELGHLPAVGCVAAVVDVGGAETARPLTLAAVAAPAVTVEAAAEAAGLSWRAFDRKGELALLRVREYAAEPAQPAATSASLFDDPEA